MIAPPLPLPVCSPLRLTWGFTCCVCFFFFVFIIIIIVKYVHWPLPNYQFLFCVERTFVDRVWLIFGSKTFCIQIKYINKSAYFLCAHIYTHCESRGRPSTWFLIKFGSMNWNCQRLLCCMFILMFPFGRNANTNVLQTNYFSLLFFGGVFLVKACIKNTLNN